MTAQDAHDFVVVTGRISAALFVVALLGAAVHRHALKVWMAFLAIHTVHFAAVLWFAVANEGRDLFPGGTSLVEAGGWPVVLGSAVLFYALALTVLLALRKERRAGRWLSWAGAAATTLIGFEFLAVYVPLVPASPVFALSVAALVVALGFYLVRTIPQPGDRPAP